MGSRSWTGLSSLATWQTAPRAAKCSALAATVLGIQPKIVATTLRSLTQNVGQKLDLKLPRSEQNGRLGKRREHRRWPRGKPNKQSGKPRRKSERCEGRSRGEA